MSFSSWLVHLLICLAVLQGSHGWPNKEKDFAETLDRLLGRSLFKKKLNRYILHVILPIAEEKGHLVLLYKLKTTHTSYLKSKNVSNSFKNYTNLDQAEVLSSSTKLKY